MHRNTDAASKVYLLCNSKIKMRILTFGQDKTKTKASLWLSISKYKAQHNVTLIYAIAWAA